MSKKEQDLWFDIFRVQIKRMLKKAYIKDIPENADAKIFAMKIIALINDHSNKNAYVFIIGLLTVIIFIMDTSEDSEG